MFKALRQSFSLRCTVGTNQLLYFIRSLPLIKKVIHDDIYGIDGFKVLAYVLVLIWQFLKNLAFKFAYVALLIALPGLPISDAGGIDRAPLFLHMFLLLSVIGMIPNGHLFAADENTRIAVSLLRMDAKHYQTANFVYHQILIFLGFPLPLILFGLLCDVPLPVCLLMTLSVAACKPISGAISIALNNRLGYVLDESKGAWFKLPTVVLLLAATYVLPMFGIVIPQNAAVIALIALIPVGLLCIPVIAHFDAYKDVTVRMLAANEAAMDEAKNMQKKASQSSIGEISADAPVTSSRKGFEYLNELFIKRHRKILWKATETICLVIAAVLLIAAALVIIRPGMKANVNKVILRLPTVLPFALYTINRGTGFTQALFMNCDHCLLTYSFFKKPKAILTLFRIRLREITKINAAPAALLGGGLCVLLALTGGTDDPLNYLVFLITPLAVSMFFSVHYLMLYYLMQPYTAGSEMKNGVYGFVLGMTYLPCYWLMRLEAPALIFGGCCILFCLLYSLIACVLVYKFAHKTFKLRS